MTPKMKAAWSAVVCALSEIIAHLASMTPDAQTSFLYDLCAVFPPEWRGPISTGFMVLSRAAALYAVVQASHSGPKTPPQNDAVTGAPTPPPSK